MCPQDDTTPSSPIPSSPMPRKTYSFAPRPGANQAQADTVVAVERQRRSFRNMIVAGIVIASSAITAALLITSEEEIKVQVSADTPQVKNESQGLELKGITFKGITEDGNDFIILAETAKENRAQPDLIQLSRPRARVDMPSGNPMTLRSLNGAFHRQDERVDLDGRVVIVRPDLGYTLMTETAVAHLDTGVMTSNTVVRGFSPRARVRADGMEITDRGQNVTFTGKSTLRISPRTDN